MSAPIPVAILGFSAFDRKALAAHFRVTERAGPRYEQVLNVDHARLVVADADDGATIALLVTLGRTAEVLFIGSEAPSGAAAWMMRPVDPLQVMRQLDALLVQRDNPRTAPLPLGLPMARTWPMRGMRTIGAAELAGAAAPPARRAGDDLPAADGRSHWHALHDAKRRLREARHQPLITPRALMVDDSEIALHFLRRQLEAYGLTIDAARDSDRALDLLTHHAYGIVFCDIDLGEASRVDGLTLCHQIRFGLRHLGSRPPLVVMVSAFHDPVVSVRGTLAGAEAMLGKPLDLTLLDDLLRRQGLDRKLPTAPLPPV
jgi:CheY-like chemotaxis protein